MLSLTLQMISQDCTILLQRALLGKTVVAFGDDGDGKYGRSSVPKYFVVNDVSVTASFDLSTSNRPHEGYTGEVSIGLQGYSSSDGGHILTDQNFKIAIRQYLLQESIDADALSWAELSDQTSTSVVMKIDIKKLLSWT